jgi:hypothetical protein
MKTCRTCKHWTYNVTAYTEYNSRETALSGECSEKLGSKVDLVVYGDGYLESVDTEPDFGCTAHEPVEVTP